MHKSPTKERIQSIVERVEGLTAERKEITDLINEVYAEAKGEGYDVAALKKIVAMRKKSADDRAEEEAVLEMYKQAMGMD